MAGKVLMLNTTEKSQLAAFVQREGGWEALAPQIVDAAADDRINAGIAALAGSISVTVTDWAKVRAVFQAASQYRISVNKLCDQIVAAGTAGDASQLGQLFVLLAASYKGHAGR